MTKTHSPWDEHHVFRCGLNNWNNKLNPVEVLEIRNLYRRRKNWTHRRLAERFKVSSQTIFSIVNGITWKWLK